jgi:hypothetical protein
MMQMRKMNAWLAVKLYYYFIMHIILCETCWYSCQWTVTVAAGLMVLKINVLDCILTLKLMFEYLHLIHATIIHSCSEKCKTLLYYAYIFNTLDVVKHCYKLIEFQYFNSISHASGLGPVWLVFVSSNMGLYTRDSHRGC